MKLKKFYHITLSFMVLLFLIFISVSSNNYSKLLKVCEEKSALIREQEDYYETNLRELDKKYNELLSKCADLEERNSHLKQRVKLPVYNYTEDEIYLLAQCVEAEAGYYDGHETSQKYVAQTILNRLQSGKFPNTIREVIYQKIKGVPQFSVAYDGSINREVQPKTLANVYGVIVNGTDLPEYVCYFYSASVTENWVNTLPIYDTVEGTVFAYESKEDY
mgnify:CR=1 FL=1